MDTFINLDIINANTAVIDPFEIDLLLINHVNPSVFEHDFLAIELQ